MFFMGTYTPKLDEKGRLILPAKFRDALEDGLVVTRAQDRSLAVYPRATFQAKMSALMSAPSTVKQVRDYQRMLMAGASDEVPDKQGRITIPPPLREYANLDREVVVIGAGERAEIWDAQAWHEYSQASEEGFSEMDDEFVALTGL
ncbi:division/cell wall cluster transcriptional repressor MraZ [Tessaracoccus sp. MC1865]|uniref:division/cell wall cluster transcriptional repressor MraZ n=1 Tax=Tessaracoccus sp. MC1865 TaxID=2760310 RepID=UPI00160070B3|nr:division/cell wall cluster transcriptional repressor MraZ [Tessaracoccus sp. MC1865]MBB1483604.1 division/cell wall cluster transcriptional repressor MraZ [Tessaracoccus sp. MC1865]QTO38947.1 division/cell wall cluster transcriptional repressor MraZ [Tessaracoccus sp. MC1865]